MTGGNGRMVLVSVGTDHHRFDRLMDWVADWIDRAPDDVRVVVQHGTSPCPPGARGYDVVPKDELSELMNEADVVLVQGGPGGIMTARREGRLPIVVPRVARLRECVDDHQVAFCRRMSSAGKIVLAESEQELFAALDAALANPPTVAVDEDAEHVHQTVERLGSAVDALVSATPRRGRRHLRPAARQHRSGSRPVGGRGA